MPDDKLESFKIGDTQKPTVTSPKKRKKSGELTDEEKKAQSEAHSLGFRRIETILEEEDVELSHVVVMRSGIRLEDQMALFLEMEAGSATLAKGLGAHDRRGHTHVFVIRETAGWWQQLPVRLEKILQESSENGNGQISKLVL